MNKLKTTLSQKFGPLPVWAWAGVVIAGVWAVQRLIGGGSSSGQPTATGSAAAQQDAQYGPDFTTGYDPSAYAGAPPGSPGAAPPPAIDPTQPPAPAPPTHVKHHRPPPHLPPCPPGTRRVGDACMDVGGGGGDSDAGGGGDSDIGGNGGGGSQHILPVPFHGGRDRLGGPSVLRLLPRRNRSGGHQPQATPVQAPPPPSSGRPRMMALEPMQQHRPSLRPHPVTEPPALTGGPVAPVIKMPVPFAPAHELPSGQPVVQHQQQAPTDGRRTRAPAPPVRVGRPRSSGARAGRPKR